MRKTRKARTPTVYNPRLAERLVKRVPSDPPGRQPRRRPSRRHQPAAWPSSDLEPGEQLGRQDLLSLTPKTRTREQVDDLLRRLHRRGHELGWIDKVVTVAWAKKYGMSEGSVADRERLRLLAALKLVFDAARVYQARRPGPGVAAQVLALEPLVSDDAPLAIRDAVTLPIAPAWTPKRRRGNTDTGWQDAAKALHARGVGGQLLKEIRSTFEL